MAKNINFANVLWIDADPVFGGSRSQVQFPVELRAFFYLPATPHIRDSVIRGIRFAGVLFPGKKMVFHHNDVWRLNLPTTKQGLGGYQGKLLVFERTNNQKIFRLWCIEKDSSAAKKLKVETAAYGVRKHKMRDNGTKRPYGFF